MGNGKYARKPGACSKKKGFKKYFLSTKHRKKDLDQIQDDLKKEVKKAFEFDEDLPGAGQFYCHETGRHFQDQHSLEMHKKTKFYKKRVRILKTEKQYTQEEAELGSGKSKEILPKLRDTRIEAE